MTETTKITLAGKDYTVQQPTIDQWRGLQKWNIRQLALSERKLSEGERELGVINIHNEAGDVVNTVDADELIRSIDHGIDANAEVVAIGLHEDYPELGTPEAVLKIRGGTPDELRTAALEILFFAGIHKRGAPEGEAKAPATTGE
jgi:hypothetical protein